MRENKKN